MKRINKLNTLKEAQGELSRLIRAYYRDEIETPKFKTLVYAFSVLQLPDRDSPRTGKAFDGVGRKASL